ncbi:MAG TPA: hypothetical protein VKG79_13680, partial [Bryobacteraceae bacterium]|nr:hypothetical protein [Bryobacteraceae bacterium]
MITSATYFLYSAREIRPPSRSTRARSRAGKDAWISSTRRAGDGHQIFRNCPRYVHHYKKIEPSKFVPRSTSQTPIAPWT